MKKLRIPHCRHIFKIKSKIVERVNIDNPYILDTSLVDTGSSIKSIRAKQFYLVICF